MRVSILLLMSLLLSSCTSITSSNLNQSVVALYANYLKISETHNEIKIRLRTLIYNIDTITTTKEYQNKYYDLLDIYDLIKVQYSSSNDILLEIENYILNFNPKRYIITKSDILDLIQLTNIIIKAVPE